MAVWDDKRRRGTAGIGLAAAAAIAAASPATAQELCEDAVGAEQAFDACRTRLAASAPCEALAACNRAERLCPSGAETYAASRASALSACEQPCEDASACLGAGYVCAEGRCAPDPRASERVLTMMLEASRLERPCRRWQGLTRAFRLARDAGAQSRLGMLRTQLERAEVACEQVSGLGGVALVGRDGAPMVLVPGGPFARGSDDAGVERGLAVCRQSYASPEDCTDAWFSRERPRRTIEMSPYYIDVYEVTNARYRQCVEAGACEPINLDRCRLFDAASGRWRRGGAPGPWVKADDHPVVCVSWADADRYCEWAGKRLPTEAEWEKAARGEEGLAFPWGDRWRPSWLNWGETSGYGSVDGYLASAPVGSFPDNKSPYGAVDMAGNVWEWTWDWHGETFYARAPQSDPRNGDVSGYKVLRGGSWHFAGNGARAAFRHLHSPAVREDTIGFRCALGKALDADPTRPDPKP